jgi:hypothetical protein
MGKGNRRRRKSVSVHFCVLADAEFAVDDLMGRATYEAVLLRSTARRR